MRPLTPSRPASPMACTLHPDTPLSSFPALAPGHRLPSSSPCGLLSQAALPDHSGRVRSAVLTGTRPLSLEQEPGCALPGRKPCLSLLSGRNPWALSLSQRLLLSSVALPCSPQGPPQPTHAGEESPLPHGLALTPHCLDLDLGLSTLLVLRPQPGGLLDVPSPSASPSMELGTCLVAEGVSARSPCHPGPLPSLLPD